MNPAVPSNNSFRRNTVPKFIHSQSALNTWVALGKRRQVLKCVCQAAEPYRHLRILRHHCSVPGPPCILLGPGKKESLRTELFIDSVTVTYTSSCKDDDKKPCRTVCKFFCHYELFCRSRHDSVKQILANNSALVFLYFSAKHYL